MSTLTVTIDWCPPGINETYGIKGNRGKGSKGLFKTDQATYWQEKAALVIGSAAAMQDWKDDSPYYSLEVLFHHPRLDADAPLKLIADTVSQKLGFNDFRITEHHIKRITDENESVTIILRGIDQIKLSFSRIDTYATCPELWRQRYLLHQKAPWSLDASYGVIVHKALKEYWEIGFEGVDSVIVNENWEYFQNKEKDILIAQSLTRKGITSLREMGINSNRLHCLSPELHLDYQDFQGYFDLLIDDCIVDWKIVNSNYDTHKLLTSEQLTCYAWLYWRQFGCLPKKVAYVNLNKWTGEAKVLSTTKTMEDIKYWERKVNAIRNLMEREIFYKEPKGCIVAKDTYCQFYDQCWGGQPIEISDQLIKFRT